MRRTLLSLTMGLALTIANVAADMPIGFYDSMNNQKYRDFLYVKNYDAGASITESYTDGEHLEKQTDVKTLSYGSSSPSGRPCWGTSTPMSLAKPILPGNQQIPEPMIKGAMPFWAAASRIWLASSPSKSSFSYGLTALLVR
jgi:hypothetical protein